MSSKPLLKSLEEGPAQDWERAHGEWISQIAEWKNNSSPEPKPGSCLKPQFVIQKINEITGSEAIITTEVGQNQMWTAQFFKFDKPRTLLTSGGLGTMGFGFPAAIGAQVAFPEKTVIDIAGDGSFQMNVQELATAVQYDLAGQDRHPEQPLPGDGPPVAAALLRPSGTRRPSSKWRRISSSWPKPTGPSGLRATKSEEVEAVIREALSIRQPVVMDFLIDRNECVYPMVPAGAALTEMLLV